MKEYDIPTTIRKQYNEDLGLHNDFCNEGYIIEINKFTKEVKENQCPYCKKFNKHFFDREYLND